MAEQTNLFQNDIAGAISTNSILEHLSNSLSLQVTRNMLNGKVYNGNTIKYGVTVDGVDYIMKYSKKNDLSVLSEYIASHFINAVGILSQETKLAIYERDVVVLCKDFVSGTEYTLHSFADTRQSSEDTDILTKDYTYDDIIYMVEKHLKLSVAEKVVLEHFWKMFIADSILGNRDRHWGNWGYLANQNEYTAAPIYDNGGSLFPGVADVLNSYCDIYKREQFVYDRVFVFPASLFRLKRDDGSSRRTNYYEMFSKGIMSAGCEKCVMQLISSYTINKIYNIIKSIVDGLDIPVMLKRFYIEIVCMRFGCIVCRQDFKTTFSSIERQLIQDFGG